MSEKTLERLVGNPHAYALQQSDGSYTPVRKPLDGGVLRRHLAGDITVGTYVNLVDKARTLVFDIDTGKESEAVSVMQSLLGLDVPPKSIAKEFSGRKGFHVWVVLQDYVPAEDLRRLGRAALALARVKCEVFPKQDEVRDLGNLVKLPGGLHKVSGERSKWLTVEPLPMPLHSWQTRVFPNLPAELSARRFEVHDNRFPCMEAIQNEGVQEGSRNNQLFHLATMLRRAGLTGEYVRLVLEDVNERCSPPVDPMELTQILDSSSRSGPVCDQVPENRHCGDLCLKTRTKGLYTRPGQLRHASEGDAVVVTVGPKNGKSVVLEHDDLDIAKGTMR